MRCSITHARNVPSIRARASEKPREINGSWRFPEATSVGTVSRLQRSCRIRRVYMRSSLLTTGCHFEPIQFLFHQMKGIVADFLVCTHGENGLPGGPKCRTMDFAGARSV